ncbi:MAG: hypothetical protein ACI4HO_08880 [Ruminococcus sp.]
MSVILYIRDNTNGKVREYGTDSHDTLVLQEDGSIHYYNLHNGTGTQYPAEGYTFSLSDGSDPRTLGEDYIEHGAEPFLDIGGDGQDLTCDACRWYGNRYQKCTTCRDNPKLKSRYEPPWKEEAKR